MEWTREGQPHYVISPLPESTERQRRAPTEEAQEMMNKKVTVLLAGGGDLILLTVAPTGAISIHGNVQGNFV